MTEKIKHLPHLGRRIIKTAIAVFICLLLHYVSGGYLDAATASIAALLCIQPYTSDTKAFALERVLGTLFGILGAFAYLLLMRYIPGRDNVIFAYFIMAVFIVLLMYGTVLIKQAGTAALATIIFLGIVITYPEVETSPNEAVRTMLSTICGVLVALGVNIAHFPKEKHPEKLFFIRTMDLLPDRYTKLSANIHIFLEYLYNDGAKICLISRWAPAFVISQMGLLNVNAPMIVMDGAALYDISTNKYLDVIEIPKENAERLHGIISEFNTFCGFYAVNERSLCIYRSGKINEAERAEYDKMKRSPYRNYMEGYPREEDKIAFIRVIDTPERIDELAYLIQSVIPPGMFRMVVREEPQFANYKGLYFYNPDANPEEMKKRVLALMEERYGEKMTSVDVLPKIKNYDPAHDSLILLNRVKSMYEPVSFKALFKKKGS